jgi:hypothetical protein
MTTSAPLLRSLLGEALYYAGRRIVVLAADETEAWVMFAGTDEDAWIRPSEIVRF